MTGDSSPIRILVLHTDEGVRRYLSDVLRSSIRLMRFELEAIDGNYLDHETTLSLLAKNYDYIYLNLRLPCGLSLRIAELAHLAKVQTRLVLVSGCDLDAELLTPLFDVFIRVPCLHGDVESALWSASALAGLARVSLPTEEHVEAAIKALATNKGADYIWGLARSDGFELYRAYFPHLPPAQLRALSANTSLAQRLSTFDVRTPVDYCSRIARTVLAISQSKLLNTTLKLFLMDQFVRTCDLISSAYRDQPRQITTLLDCLEGFAAVLAGKHRNLDAAQLTEPVMFIPGFESLARLTQNVLKMLAAERSV